MCVVYLLLNSCSFCQAIRLLSRKTVNKYLYLYLYLFQTCTQTYLFARYYCFQRFNDTKTQFTSLINFTVNDVGKLCFCVFYVYILLPCCNCGRSVIIINGCVTLCYVMLVRHITVILLLNAHCKRPCGPFVANKCMCVYKSTY